VIGRGINRRNKVSHICFDNDYVQKNSGTSQLERGDVSGTQLVSSRPPVFVGALHVGL